MLSRADSFFLSALLRAPFFVWSSTFVPLSLLRNGNRKEKNATKANFTSTALLEASVTCT